MASLEFGSKPGRNGREGDLVDLYFEDFRPFLQLERKEEQLLFQLYEGSKKSEEVLDYFLNNNERSDKWEECFQRLIGEEGDQMTGQELAEKTIITCNLPLVVSVAKEYIGRSLDLEFSDVIQEGNLGLIRAIEKFDWRRGNKFSTYAVNWIKKSISEALKNKGRNVRLPVHIIDRIIFLNRKREHLEQQLGRSARVEDLVEVPEIAQKFDLPKGKKRAVEQLDQFLILTQQPLFLQGLVGNNGKERDELGDFVPDDYNLEEEVLNSLVNSARTEEILSALEECLSPREERIVRVALMDKDSSFDVIGEKFGLSGEGVRRILRIAEWKTRFHLYFDNGDNGNLSEDKTINRLGSLLENFENVDMFFFLACLGIKKTGLKKHLPSICEKLNIDYRYENGNIRFAYSSAEAVKIIKGFYNHPDFTRAGHKVKCI